MSEREPTRRVLLVDDESALAWSLSSRLGRARPHYLVDTAEDGESALAKLHDHGVDLLVADVRMPGISGIELIMEAWKLDSDLKVIVMTAFKSPEVDQLIAGSSIRYIEKPFEFEYFMALVDDALKKEPQQQDGFSGAISVQTLPDVVQLYVLANSTGTLRIRHHSGEGSIYFHQGAVLDARTPKAVGNEAFFEIMLWRGGEFSMRTGAAPTEHSITSNWQELIMESCRRIDEKRRNELPIEHESKAGWTLAPPSLVGDDDPFADFDMAQTRPDRASISRLTNEINHDNAKENSMNIKDCLVKLNAIDGFIGAALVDAESGMLLGQEGGGSLNLEVAAAGNTEVVKAKRKVMGNLGIKDGIIEDILITLNKQYHMIRPLRSRSTLFFYVALDRSRANLAMARITLADVEKDLQV